MNKTYKINIIGDANSGKTTYTKLLIGLGYEKRYMATVGVEVHPLKLNTNHTNQKDVILNLWDCAGQFKFIGKENGFFRDSDAAIVMYNINSIDYDTKVDYWISRYKSIESNESNPIAVIGNKIDLSEGPDLYRNSNNRFYTSCKEELDLWEPITYLIDLLNEENKIM